jgi:hypothetical protein
MNSWCCNIRDEPATKPQVLSPSDVWRRKSSKLGSCAAGVGTGLQLSGTACAVGSGSDHGKAAAYAIAGARSTQNAYVNVIVEPCERKEVICR